MTTNDASPAGGKYVEHGVNEYSMKERNEHQDLTREKYIEILEDRKNGIPLLKRMVAEAEMLAKKGDARIYIHNQTFTTDVVAYHDQLVQEFLQFFGAAQVLTHSWLQNWHTNNTARTDTLDDLSRRLESEISDTMLKMTQSNNVFRTMLTTSLEKQSKELEDQLAPASTTSAGGTVAKLNTKLQKQMDDLSLKLPFELKKKRQNGEVVLENVKKLVDDGMNHAKSTGVGYAEKIDEQNGKTRWIADEVGKKVKQSENAIAKLLPRIRKLDDNSMSTAEEHVSDAKAGMKYDEWKLKRWIKREFKRGDLDLMKHMKDLDLTKYIEAENERASIKNNNMVTTSGKQDDRKNAMQKLTLGLLNREEAKFAKRLPNTFAKFDQDARSIQSARRDVQDFADGVLRPNVTAEGIAASAPLSHIQARGLGVIRGWEHRMGAAMDAVSRYEKTALAAANDTFQKEDDKFGVSVTDEGGALKRMDENAAQLRTGAEKTFGAERKELAGAEGNAEKEGNKVRGQLSSGAKALEETLQSGKTSALVKTHGLGKQSRALLNQVADHMASSAEGMQEAGLKQVAYFADAGAKYFDDTSGRLEEITHREPGALSVLKDMGRRIAQERMQASEAAKAGSGLKTDVNTVTQSAVFGAKQKGVDGLQRVEHGSQEVLSKTRALMNAEGKAFDENLASSTSVVGGVLKQAGLAVKDADKELKADADALTQTQIGLEGSYGSAAAGMNSAYATEQELQQQAEAAEQSVQGTSQSPDWASGQMDSTLENSAMKASTDATEWTKQQESAESELTTHYKNNVATWEGKVDRTYRATAEEQQELANMVQAEERALQNFAHTVQRDDVNKAGVFFEKMKSVQGQVNVLWKNVEKGSDEERRLLSARSKMLEAAMSTTLEGASDATKTEMQEHFSNMEAKMKEVMHDTSLSEEEVAEKIRQLEEESHHRASQILERDANLGHLAEQYKADADAAAADQLEAVESGEHNAEGIQVERKRGAESIKVEQDRQTQRVLLAVLDAERAADSLEAHDNLALAAAKAKEEESERSAVQATEYMYRDLDTSMMRTAAQSRSAARAARRAEDESSSVLRRTAGLLASLTAERGGKFGDLLGEMGREEELASTGQQDLSAERKALFAELAGVLDDAHKLNRAMLRHRVAAVDTLDKDLEASLGMLSEAGHQELADMMRSSVELAHKMAKMLLTMKLTMYDDMHQEARLLGGGEALRRGFRDLRTRMATAARQTAGLVGQMEVQLRARLAEMGITGKRAADMLAVQMHQLQYQLSSGAHDGLEQLLSDIYDQFGTVVELGIEEDKTYASAVSAVVSKHEDLSSLISALASRLGSVKGKKEAFRRELMKLLGGEQQLMALSTYELRRKVARLKTLIAQRAIRDDVAYPAPAGYGQQVLLQSAELRPELQRLASREKEVRVRERVVESAQGALRAQLRQASAQLQAQSRRAPPSS
jgi:hypothetical protein